MRQSMILGVLAGTLAIATLPAIAQPVASQSGCIEMRAQVQEALDSNAQSPNHEEAVKQQRYGTEFCNGGFYQNGVNHYAQALKLLSVNKG